MNKNCRLKLNAYDKTKDGSANLVYGAKLDTEGIFFEISQKKIIEWLRINQIIREEQVPDLNDDLAVKKWFAEYVHSDEISMFGDVDENESITKNVFGLLHSMSHAFIRMAGELSGLSSNSLTEIIIVETASIFIYAQTSQGIPLKKVFGGGGDVRFWRAYQKAIADVRVDFKPEGLDEYWLNEAKTFNDETRIMIGEIENKLKTIISDSLQEYFGTSWLVKGLPKNTYTKAKKLADEKAYDLQLNSGDDAEDVNVWDFVSLADYVSIVTNGKNWSSFFEEMLVRPEETRIAGGKEAKTQWILRLSAIKNKLSKESYSVPVDEYSYVKSVYDWIMEMLTL